MCDLPPSAGRVDPFTPSLITSQTTSWGHPSHLSSLKGRIPGPVASSPGRPWPHANPGSGQTRRPAPGVRGAARTQVRTASPRLLRRIGDRVEVTTTSSRPCGAGAGIGGPFAARCPPLPQGLRPTCWPSPPCPPRPPRMHTVGQGPAWLCGTSVMRDDRSWHFSLPTWL